MVCRIREMYSFRLAKDCGKIYIRHLFLYSGLMIASSIVLDVIVDRFHRVTNQTNALFFISHWRRLNLLGSLL